MASQPDFVLTVEPNGRVRGTRGDVQTHLGMAPQQVVMQSALSFFEPRSRKPLAALLQSQKANKEITLANIKVVNLAGGTGQFYITITRLPKKTSRLSFYLSTRDLDPEDFATGVISLDDLLDRMAESALEGAKPDSRFVLLTIDEMVGEAALEGIEKKLAESSVDGTVGRFGKSGFGLVADADTDDRSLQTAVEEEGAVHGIAPEALGLRMDSVEIGETEAPRRGLQAVFGRLVRAFTQGKSLKEEVGPSLGAAAGAVAKEQEEVLLAIRQGDILISSVPIFDLSNNAKVALLVTARLLLSGEREVAPEGVPGLADSPDIASAFDLAMLKIAAKRYNGLGELEESAMPMIVTLQPATLRVPEILSRLDEAVQDVVPDHVHLGYRLLGFDPRERRGRTWRTISRMAGRGHPMCFTNFVSALDGISAIKLKGVGFVEAPAHLLADLAATDDGQSRLSRLVTVWGKSKVKLLAHPAGENHRADLAAIGIPYAAIPGGGR